MKRNNGKRLPIVLAGCLLALLGAMTAVHADGQVYYDDLGNAALLLTGAEGCTVTYWPEGQPEAAVTVDQSEVEGDGFALYEAPGIDPGVVYEFTATCEVPEGFSLEGRFVAAPGPGTEPVSGEVVDADGNPVAGALVLVRPVGSDAGSFAVTDEDGYWSVPLVAAPGAGVAVGDLPGRSRLRNRGPRRHRARARVATPASRLVITATADGMFGSAVVANDGQEKVLTVRAVGEDCAAMVCDVTDSGFAAFWESGADTLGHLRWGLDPEHLDSVACDVRDGLHAGDECRHVGDVHLVPVTGVAPATTVYFQVFEGDLPVGGVCAATTGPVLGKDDPGLDAEHAAWGKVLGPDGVTPFPDAVVVVRLRDGDTWSAPLCVPTAVRTRDGHNWLAPIGLARTEDGAAWYAETDDTMVVEEAFGGAAGYARQEVPYEDAAPSPPLVLGERYADGGEACPDEDGDGYAVCDEGCDPGELECGDCDDGNADVNPGVAEVCDDGVDNDCDGAIDADDTDCMEGGELAPVAPAPGTAFHTCDAAPTFSWTDGGWERFYVTFSTSAEFEGDVLAFGAEEPFTGTSWTPTESEWRTIVSLAATSEEDLVVYWRPVAVADDGEHPGAASSFVILAQEAPVPTSPADGSHFGPGDALPVFSWEPGACNVAFRLEFSLSADFTPPVVLLPRVPLTTPSWQPPMAQWRPVTTMAARGEGGSEGTTVYWRVVATDDLGRVTRSEAASVVVEGSAGRIPRRLPRRFR